MYSHGRHPMKERMPVFITKAIRGALSVIACMVAWSADCSGQEEAVSLQKTFSSRPVARFQNGHFFAKDSQEVPGTPIAFLFNPRGEVIRRVPFKYDGMADIDIAAIAPAADGSMVVSVASVATTGERVFLLVWVDTAGQVKRTVRTSPYAATHLYMSTEGELWAAGREIEPNISLRKGHDIVRRYSAGGELIQSCLNLSSFPPLGEMRGHPDTYAHLFGGGGRVGFISGNAKELVEIDPNSCGLTRTRFNLPEGAEQITGADFAVDGSVVASFNTPQGNAVVLARLRRGSSEWQRIDPPTLADGSRWSGYLLGADGPAWWLALPAGGALKYRVAQ